MKVGIVCGLKSESRALGLLGRDAFVSGAHAGRAYEGAKGLAEKGADCLLSVGLSGALASDLEPGAFLLPSRVVSAEGAWRATQPPEAMLQGADLRAAYGSDAIVTTAAEKRRLGETGAASVDMESHAVARAAAEAGLPFYVIRAVADGASQALPPSAAGAVRPDGSVNTLRTLAALLTRPGDLPALLALGRQASRGLATLRARAVPLIAYLRAEAPQPKESAQ